MSKGITPEYVRKEITAALKATNQAWAEKYEESQERAAELTSKVKALTDEAAKAKHAQAVDQGDVSFLTDIRGSTAEQTLDNLRQAAGMTVFGDGEGRAHIPGGDVRGLDAARMIRALAQAEITKQSALDVAHNWGDKRLERNLEKNADLVAKARSGSEHERQAALRALGSESLGSGASFVQTELASQIIPLLQPRTCLRRLGVGSMPLPTGKMRLPFIEEGAEAEYVKECSGPNATKITDGELFVERKILSVLVCMCNEWLQESSYAVDALLRDHLLDQLARKEDIAFIRGDGLQNSPFGLSYFADLAGNVELAPDISALAPVDKIQAIMDFLTNMMACVECNDLPVDNTAWIMACRTKYALMRCLDGNGNRVFFDEMLNAGTLLGRPYCTTTQIPTTLDFTGGGNDNETELYFADISSLQIYETGGIETDVFRDATYRNGKGQTIHGVNDRHTVIRATARHDFVATQRGKEVCKGVGLAWGA